MQKKYNMANSTTAKDCWSRLSQVVEESGLTLHSFAMAIGLSRSETLYQIRRGQIGISNKVADAVIAAYPQYNKAWLLTGFGNKYADPSQVKGHIPFYNCNLSQIVNIEHLVPESYIFLPMASSADFAIIYHGDDMMPSIPSGTVLMLSKCEPKSVIFGNEYVVQTDQYVTLRRVRSEEYSSAEPTVRLEADDSQRFDSQRIRIADISALYAVKARIILKN